MKPGDGVRIDAATGQTPGADHAPDTALESSDWLDPETFDSLPSAEILAFLRELGTC